MVVLISRDDEATRSSFKRLDLKSQLNEDWLQSLIFDQPDLVPLEQLEPGSGSMIPLVRELALPKPSGAVFLDLLGVTAFGRLVLLECKLWRNPQARREVIAQILEYAALLRRWSYADLTAHLKAKGWSGENPIYDRVAASGATVDEAVFSDAVAKSLRQGDFNLIVAGDGIREDMASIADHLQMQGARLALVEFQVWQDEQGQKLVLPLLPFRTEVSKQRILVREDDRPVEIEDVEDTTTDARLEAAEDPDKAVRKAAIRAFWQRFIDEVEFDHPNQQPPRHGGNNWVKIPLVGGARLTAFRIEGKVLGLFLAGPQKAEAYDLLKPEAQSIIEETGLRDMRFHRFGDPETFDSIGIEKPLARFADEEEQLEWLKETSNTLVTALRPRLSRLRS